MTAITRFRVAADATAAVKEFDSTVQQVVNRMRVTGATHVGDVDWCSSTDAA